VILVDQNYPVLSLMGSSGGADLHAWWVVAMLALDGKEFPGIIRKFSVLPLFQPVITLLCRKAVLVLAGDAAGVTTHAFAFIYDHPVSGHLSLGQALVT